VYEPPVPDPMGPTTSRAPLLPDLRTRSTGFVESPPIQVIVTVSPAVRLVKILVIFGTSAATRARREAPARSVLKKCMLKSKMKAAVCLQRETRASVGRIRK